MYTKEQVDAIEKAGEAFHPLIMALHAALRTEIDNDWRALHGMAQSVGGAADSVRAWAVEQRKRLDQQAKLDAWVEEQMTPTEGCDCSHCNYLRDVAASYTIKAELSDRDYRIIARKKAAESFAKAVADNGTPK